MTASLHPAAPHHLPVFITESGETDVLMVVMAVFLVLAVLAVGILFLRLHTLPERMAHKSHKLQFEIVGVLGLLALFTHQHIFWVAGLLLALIDIPDFGGAFSRMAGSLEGVPPAGAGRRPVDRAAVDRAAAGRGGGGRRSGSRVRNRCASHHARVHRGVGSTRPRKRPRRRLWIRGGVRRGGPARLRTRAGRRQ